jgi:DGQHR domain-containing protein
MDARELRALTGIQRRQSDPDRPRIADIGIQRALDEKRSEEIGRYVEHGFPWSTLNQRERQSQEFNDLRKPGWLPTAIVVNVLTGRDRRPNGQVATEDLIVVESSGDQCTRLQLPQRFGPQWSPSALHPLEVIDGQHRLWAFDPCRSQPFDLPVVAFIGLDISWQAYLFWTINIKPTKINPSLAFDLYPLLRTEDWLEHGEGPAAYRDARAQELTEALWSFEDSPWAHRINMLGQTRGLGVTQAGWIRSLSGTFFRRGARKGSPPGLFAGRIGERKELLAWNRTQQAAFLVFGWQRLATSIAASRDTWAESLRFEARRLDETFALDPAFAGRNTYLNTEQGVRAYLAVLNDLTVVAAEELPLETWVVGERGGEIDPDSIRSALLTLEGHPIGDFVGRIGASLGDFDWRGADAPGLNADQRALKRAFRGSGGYAEFRWRLLRHIGRNGDPRVRPFANDLWRVDKSR